MSSPAVERPRPEDEHIAELAAALRRHGAHEARVAVVLGSGLGALVDALEGAVSVPFAELAGMPVSRVPGHAGRIVVGDLEGTPVLVQAGRVHLYEGWEAREVTRSVRAYARLGLRGLVLTNAAGGLRREWPVGTLMRLSDHVDLQRSRPLRAGEARRGSPYDRELGALLDAAAARTGTALENGVYAAVLGPSYETPAEVRRLAWMGADAVGMSTAAEASAARAAGLRVAAVSCVTNHAAGLSPDAPSHEEVLAVGREAGARLVALLRAALPDLARAV